MQEKTKILIIGRTIYPSQFPRSFRATELAIELAKNKKYDVTLYGVLGKFDYTDFEAKYNVKIKNIGKMFFATLNSDGYSRNSVFDKFLWKIFNKLIEYPDIELIFKVLRVFRTELNCNVLISVGMPYPIHWGCAFAKLKYSENFPNIWIADCGDPYMGNKMVKRKPFFYFKYLEKLFCKAANYITIPIEESKSSYFPEFNNKIRVISQGFRMDKCIADNVYKKNSVPTFAYAGTFYKDIRDPRNFLDYLCTVEFDFKFILYTENASLLVPYQNILKDKLIINNYVDREILILELAKMDFLINFENGTNVQSPSKLIDYALTKRPILSIPSGSLNIQLVKSFFEYDFAGQLELKDLDKYNIKNVARQFEDLFLS